MKRKIENINISIRVKDGYGTYDYFIGYCETCEKFRIHTCVSLISTQDNTCEKGHYSKGEFDIRYFNKNEEEYLDLVLRLLKDN